MPFFIDGLIRGIETILDQQGIDSVKSGPAEGANTRRPGSSTEQDSSDTASGGASRPGR